MSDDSAFTSEDARLIQAAARTGNQVSFNRLAEAFRKELLTHCYRMTGSFQDAEDLVQETFIRAWRRLDTFEGRASFRAWLYKIATNACLDVLRRRPKRTLPQHRGEASDPLQPPLPPVNDPIWLEPFPDDLLAPLDTGPEARYESHESIHLAFLAAIQMLSPRQRAALIVCDVLDWSVADAAGLLGVSESAVHSLLYRARGVMRGAYRPHLKTASITTRTDNQIQTLLSRYVQSWETGDIDGLIVLLKEDAVFPMPPLPSWYRGREHIRAFLSAELMSGDARGRWRLSPAHANSQPAFIVYRREAVGSGYTAYVLQVLTIQDDLLSEITTFGYPNLLPRFGIDSDF